MSILDKVGRIARRAGSAVQETVGGLVDDALLSDEGRRAFARAEAAIGHGQWEDALAELDKVEAARPGLMRTALLRGVAWLELGREARSVHFLEKAIGIRESIEGYYFLGLAYERAERLTDARNALLAAAQQERDPELAFDILFALGRVYLAMHRADKAIRELERALATRPGDPACVTLLAAALRRQGQEERAIALLEEQQSHLNGAEPWILLGQLQHHAGHHTDASVAFERALEIEERVDALEGAAAAAWAAGDVEATRRQYRRARRVDGDSGRLRTIAGQLALADGNLELAIEHFDGALQLTPNSTDALVGLGDAHLRLGDYTAAADAFTRALAREPEHHDALIGAGRARLAIGDRAAALRLLDQARAIDADHRVFAALADLAAAGDDPLEALVLLREAIALAPRARVDELQKKAASLEASIASPVAAPAAVDEKPLVDFAPAELAPWVRGLRDHVATVPLARDKTTELSQLLDELDAPLKVAVLGEFNAGKSTLVNAWLGEPVVATGVLPTTAHLNVIRYGPRRVAHVVTQQDGLEHRREVAWSDLSAAVAEADPEWIDHIEYFYPHPELRALHFVDTPGFNAAVDGHSEIASRMLTDADAVLWIVDTNQALSASQRDLLEAIPGCHEKVLVVLNKVDGLDSEDVQEVLDFLERNVGELVRAIVPLSALRAYEARNAAREGEPPSSDTLREAHWSEFEALLANQIMARSSQLKVLEAVRHLGAIAQDIDGLAAKNAKRLRLLAEQMTEGAETLARAREKLVEREVVSILERFGDQRRIALTTVAREAGDARRPLGGWLSALGLGQDDLSFVLGLLEERMERALQQARFDLLDAVREPVEAALATLEWIAGALASDQAQTMFARLSAFVTEDRMLRRRLDDRVIGWHRAHLSGRIAAASADVELASRLGAEDGDDEARKRVLAGVLGRPADRLGVDLRAWTREYFDAALRLCDNVRRDIERLRLQVEHDLRTPFGQLSQTISPTAPSIDENDDVDS